MEITSTLGPITDAEGARLLSTLKQLGSDTTRIVKPELSGRRVGDLTAVYLAVIGAVMTVRAIGLYLATARAKSKTSVHIEVVQPDGSKRIERIELHTSENRAADPDMVRALANLFSMPIPHLEKELQAGEGTAPDHADG